MIYHLYTDGACQPNPGKGGWAFILYPEGFSEKRIVNSGYCEESTNNRMEITAVLKGLETVNEALKSPNGEKPVVKLFSDSNYVLSSIKLWMSSWSKNGWKKSNKKPILNADLWKEIYKLDQKLDITCTHIKGHSGHLENEECDRLAVEQISQQAK